MKEVRFFYAPDAATSHELPADEAVHALRVLRLKAGDEIMLMDGRGNFFRAEVSLAHAHHCMYDIKETIPQPRQWLGHVHLARVVKIPRADKIVIAATKQSHKAWKAQLNEMVSFDDFIRQPRQGRKYIAHCYEEVPRTYFYKELCQSDVCEDAVVLVGPEGDFSIDEVRRAVACGYQSVHLGQSRLRTETAGLSAVMMMQLSKT